MSFFEINIAGIKQNNPVLADKITDHLFNDTVSFEFAPTDSKDTNLIYKGIMLHDNKDPQLEAQSIFDKLQDTSESSISIVIGLGIGYLFKRLYLSSKGKIVVYEPNLDILRFTLEVVNFSKELADKRVFIASSKLELMKFLNENYPYKACLNICGLSSANVLYPEISADFQENLPKIIANLESNYNTLFQKSFKWATEGLQNVPVLARSYNIDVLKDKFKSKPAVIVSSGPSLDKTVRDLAKYRDKVIIFSVSNAYKTLAKYNIKPDFIVFIESEDTTPQINGLDISDVNLIGLSVASIATFTLKPKRKFVFYCKNNLFSRWIADSTGFSIDEYENKGTVSYCSLYSAYKMGCNPIILLGQDLAYSDGKCYSADSAYGSIRWTKDENSDEYRFNIENISEFKKYYIKEGYLSLDVTEEEFIAGKINGLSSNITFVQGQDGKVLPTDMNYSGFIQLLESFAYDRQSDNPDLKLINCSTGGAQINGYTNRILTEILNNINTTATDVEAIINNALTGYKEPVREKIEEIASRLKYLIEDVDEFIPFAKDGLEKSEKLLIELRKTSLNIENIRILTSDLMGYYFKFQEQLFDCYIVLTDCVFKELLEISHIFENENPKIDSVEDLRLLAQASRALYTMFLDRVLCYRNIAEVTLNRINKQFIQS